MGKKKIKKFLKKLEELKKENEVYGPKYFGEAKSVEYEIDGLVHSFCKVTEWSNGEGFDIGFETNLKDKSISIHLDELECLLMCLDHLKYFEE